MKCLAKLQWTCFFLQDRSGGWEQKADSVHKGLLSPDFSPEHWNVPSISAQFMLRIYFYKRQIKFIVFKLMLFLCCSFMPIQSYMTTEECLLSHKNTQWVLQSLILLPLPLPLSFCSSSASSNIPSP